MPYLVPGHLGLSEFRPLPYSLYECTLPYLTSITGVIAALDNALV